MVKYAAHDDVSVYAFGDSPEEAISNAKLETGDAGAHFAATPIAEDFAAEIAVKGWDPSVDAFKLDAEGRLVRDAA